MSSATFIPHPLTRALRLEQFEGTPIVAFVGGGGKTTTMFMLATELAAQGRRVVTTTTTRLFASQRAQSPAWCGVDQLEQLGAYLDTHGQCLVTAEQGAWEDAKARGIEPDQVERLAAREDVDIVLVEADGSRTRPFKAPASHEPVIPAGSTHVVPLVGADIFGKPLDATHAHRPERIAALAGVEPGTPVTPDLVARVLTAEAGGLRHVPDGAAFIPFLNKVEDGADAMEAEACARLLLAHPRVREVLLGSLHAGMEGRRRSFPLHPSSFVIRRSRPATILLAAGLATRFGEPKQLLDWRGQALVAHVAGVALEVCETVLVVVGHEAEAVARAVDHLPVEVIFNEQFASGQGSSVAAGVADLMESSRPFIGEAFFMLADQPFVTSELLRHLRTQRGLHPIAIPRHGGTRGNPVLFDAALFPALRALTGDEGGRALFERYREEIAWLEVEEGAFLEDIDSREDWEAIQEARRESDEEQL